LTEREQEISTLKTERIKNYLICEFKNSTDEEFHSAYYALKNWDKFSSSRDNPYSTIERKDIDDYIRNFKMKKAKDRTIANALHYLGLFFKYYNEAMLSIHINERKKEFDTQIRNDIKNNKPIPEEHITRLYQKAKPKYKVIMRLLMVEPYKDRIPIKALNRLKFIQINQETYQFSLDNKIIEITRETSNLAKPLMEKNMKKGDFRLFTITLRTMNAQIKTYSKKAGLPEHIKLMDLVKYSRNRTRDELIDILQG
jgi:hypothetical protein